MQNLCRGLSIYLVLGFLANPNSVIADKPCQEGDTENILETFRAVEDGVGHLVLPVVINKRKYKFVLDTCATHVGYDTSFRSILGKCKSKKYASTPPAGNVEVEYFGSPTAFLGKMDMKTDEDIGLLDLENIRIFSGCDIYGIIGMTFLKQHIVRIDFDKGEVHFLKMPGNDAGHAFRLTYRNGFPCAEVRIPGYETAEKFLIDTGADVNGGGDMSYDLYKVLTKRELTTRSGGSSRSILFAGGGVAMTDFRLKSMSLGRFAHHNLIFNTSPKARYNILGLGFLSRFIVTFDFPNRVMYLQKGKMFDLPDGKDRSGLTICRRGGKIVVNQVSEFGPVSLSGINRLDVIESINGYRAHETSLYSLRRLLSMGGKTVHLVLQRGDQRFKVSVTLPRDRDKETEKKRGRNSNNTIPENGNI